MKVLQQGLVTADRADCKGAQIGRLASQLDSLTSFEVFVAMMRAAAARLAKSHGASDDIGAC